MHFLLCRNENEEVRIAGCIACMDSVLTGEGHGDGEALDLSFVSGISTELIRSPFIGIRLPISCPDDVTDTQSCHARDRMREKNKKSES
jgi:hypothetical protein